MAVGHRVAKAVAAAVVAVRGVDIAAVGIDADATMTRRGAAGTVGHNVIFNIACYWEVATQDMVFVGCGIAVGRCRGVV